MSTAAKNNLALATYLAHVCDEAIGRFREAQGSILLVDRKQVGERRIRTRVPDREGLWGSKSARPNRPPVDASP
jgi:hypothetical protein